MPTESRLLHMYFPPARIYSRDEEGFSFVINI